MPNDVLLSLLVSVIIVFENGRQQKAATFDVQVTGKISEEKRRLLKLAGACGLPAGEQSEAVLRREATPGHCVAWLCTPELVRAL